MNDLQICNENGELINMQIDSCNAAADFFDAISKKGTRDFVTQMGKLNLKAREIQLKEDTLQQQYSIAELKENNKYRLAMLNLRNAEVEAQNKVDLAKIRAISEYKQAELAAETRIRRDKIAAEKEIQLEKLRIEQLRINEQSKCLQQLLSNVKDAYDRKYDFYEAQLKFCMDFFYPQIQLFDQQIKLLTKQYNSNFENQEAHMMTHRQLKRLERARRDINDKVEEIVSNLTDASKLAKLEFDETIYGYLK